MQNALQAVDLGDPEKVGFSSTGAKSTANPRDFWHILRFPSQGTQKRVFWGFLGVFGPPPKKHNFCPLFALETRSLRSEQKSEKNAINSIWIYKACRDFFYTRFEC